MRGELRLRPATVHDVPTICLQRRSMFEDMGITPRVPFVDAIAAFGHWLVPRVAKGEYLGWIVEDGGRAVAGAGLWLVDWPPTPQSLATRRGYVLNVYTSPSHRGRGIARELMQVILTHCARQGIDVITLHASNAGRPLYESLGFTATNEMRLEPGPA